MRQLMGQAIYNSFVSLMSDLAISHYGDNNLIEQMPSARAHQPVVRFKMENEDWKIIIDSEHCPFCVQDLTAHEWYCDHSQNKGKECAEGLCPVSSQQKDSADNRCYRYHAEHKMIGMNYCFNCGISFHR